MRTNGASKNQDWPDQNGDDLSKLSMLLWYLWYVYLWVCIPMGMYTYGMYSDNSTKRTVLRPNRHKASTAEMVCIPTV